MPVHTEKELQDIREARKGNGESNVLKLGDLVEYRRYMTHGSVASGIVVGFPTYSPDGEVVVLSCSEYLGMPLHRNWCVKISSGHDYQYLRGKLLEISPDFLVPEREMA